jgi:hypothetical protein
MLTKQSYESDRTMFFYFLNLLAFLFVLIIYLGLMIILGTAQLMHIYDIVNYEPDEFLGEFITEKEFEDAHGGHILGNAGQVQHFTPFDFSSVQHSVWFAWFPTTVFLFSNLRVLLMDNLSEYVAFRDLRFYFLYKAFSLVQLIAYVAFAATKLPHYSEYLVWRNFEGLAIYSLLCVQAVTLYEYTVSKKADL